MKKTKLLTLALVALTVSGVANAGENKDHKGGHEGRFMKADTNNDGNISKAEFVAQSEKHFAKLDTNSDGNVTKDELAAMKEKYKERKAAKEAEAK